MIERDEVIRLVNLSKLNMSDSEIDKLTEDMQSVVEFADKINDACPTDVSDYANVQEMRNDEVSESYPREMILRNASTTGNGFFKLPRRSEQCREK